MKKRKGCRLFRSLVAHCRRIRGSKKRNNDPVDSQLTAHGELISAVPPGSSTPESTQSADGELKNRSRISASEDQVDIEVIQSTVTLDAHIGRSKLNVRQKNKRAPSASHLKMRLQAADEDQLSNFNLCDDKPFIVIHNSQTYGIHKVNVEEEFDICHASLAGVPNSDSCEELEKSASSQVKLKSGGIGGDTCESVKSSKSAGEVLCISSQNEHASSSSVTSVAACANEELQTKRESQISEKEFVSSTHGKLSMMSQQESLLTDVTAGKKDNNENDIKKINIFDEDCKQLRCEEKLGQSNTKSSETNIAFVCNVVEVKEPTVVSLITADAKDLGTGAESAEANCTREGVKQIISIPSQMSPEVASVVDSNNLVLIKRRHKSSIVSSQIRHSTDVSSVTPKYSSVLISRNQSDCGIKAEDAKTADLCQAFCEKKYLTHTVQDSATQGEEASPSLHSVDKTIEDSWKVSRTASAVEMRNVPIKNSAVQLLREQYSKVSNNSAALKQEEVDTADLFVQLTEHSGPKKFGQVKSVLEDSRSPMMVAKEGSGDAAVTSAHSKPADLKLIMEKNSAKDEPTASVIMKANELNKVAADRGKLCVSAAVDIGLKSTDKIATIPVTSKATDSSVKPAVTVKVPSWKLGPKVQPVIRDVSEKSPAWTKKCPVDWKIEEAEKIQSCIDISHGFLNEEEGGAALKRDGARSSVRDMVRKLQGQKVG